MIMSMLKSFLDGDISKWLQCFKICSKANNWNTATQVKKLPMLLEVEALTIWLELATDVKDDIKKVKEGFVQRMTPAAFMSLDVFHRHVLQPCEAFAVFTHGLMKLLGQGLPDLETAASDQLLQNQFLAGLPATVSQKKRQLRTVGKAKSLQAAFRGVRLLMPWTAKGVKSQRCQARSMEQVTRLTEQVAALSTSSRSMERREGVRCFACNRMGHMRCMCPNYRQGLDTQHCFKCGKQGHLDNDNHQGNNQGHLPGAAGIPK